MAGKTIFRKDRSKMAIEGNFNVCKRFVFASVNRWPGGQAKRGDPKNE